QWFVDHDLREPGTVAEDEKRNARKRALPVQPALQQHSLARVRRELRREDPFHSWHLPSQTSPGGAGGRRSRGATALPPSDKVSQGARSARMTAGRPAARGTSLPVVATSRSVAKSSFQNEPCVEGHSERSSTQERARRAARGRRESRLSPTRRRPRAAAAGRRPRGRAGSAPP